MLHNPFPTATKQAIGALVFILGAFIIRVIRVAWPMLVFAFTKPDTSTRNGYLLFYLIALFSISLVLALLNYFRFFFYVKDGNLIIEKGVLKKTKLQIPFERIQTINTEQTLSYRILGLVKLEIDTAGSKNKEAEIKALSYTSAHLLKQFILQEKHAEQAKHSLENELETDSTSENHDEPVLENSPSKLFTLSLIDLLKVGSSQNHLRALFIFFAFAFGRFNTLKDLFGEQVFEYLDQLENSNFWTNSYLVVLIIVLGLIVSFLVSLIRTIFKHFNYSFFKTATGFEMQAGLLTKRTQALNLNRLQQLNFSSDPIKRAFNLRSIKLLQATSGDTKQKDAIEIPGCYPNQFNAVKDFVFENTYLPENFVYGIEKAFVLRSLLLYAVLPTTIIYLLLAVYFDWHLYTLTSALLLPILALRIYYYHKNYRFAISNDLIHIKKGAIFQKDELLWIKKLQSIELGQNLHQQRLDLANITLHAAAGSLRIPYIKLSDARQLQNYMLYKMELYQQESF